MIRRLIVAAFLFSAVIGCDGISPSKFNEPVSVRGSVALANGSPAKNVILYLQPTGDGLPAEIPVGADGTFTGNVTPGKYTYYLGAKSEVALKDIPEAFRAGSLDRQITVKEGEKLTLKLQ